MLFQCIGATGKIIAFGAGLAFDLIDIFE